MSDSSSAPEAQRTPEKERLRAEWVDLGHAPSFRLNVPPEFQLALTNIMRLKGIISVLEGNASIVGFLTNEEEYGFIQGILQILKEEEGLATSLTIGLSPQGDSRLRYFEDTGAIMMTCEGVIAAARVQNSLNSLPETPMYTGDGFFLSSEAAEDTVPGAKNQPLTKVDLHQYFEALAVKKPDNLPKALFEPLEEKIVELGDATSFNVFQIDITGFSKAIKERLGRTEETEKFLTLVSDFLIAFEDEVLRRSVDAEGKTLFTPHFQQWEGDALPIIVDSTYTDVICDAFHTVLHQPEFSEIIAKAVAVKVGSAKVRVSGKRAVLDTSVEVRKLITEGEKIFQTGRMERGWVVIVNPNTFGEKSLFEVRVPQSSKGSFPPPEIPNSNEET